MGWGGERAPIGVKDAIRKYIRKRQAQLILTWWCDLWCVAVTARFALRRNSRQVVDGFLSWSWVKPTG